MFNQFNYGEGQQPDQTGADDDDHRTIPDYDSEFDSSKMFLQRCSSLSGDNLYDHLAEVLNKILAERPENIVDFFEEYSRQVKENRYKSQASHLEDMYVPPAKLHQANRFMDLYKPVKWREQRNVDPEDEELADMSKNDMLQLLYLFEQVGIGLPKQEMFNIMLAMRKLIHNEPIVSLRFWGKIFGLYKNYIVVECELKEEEYIKRAAQFEAPESAIIAQGGSEIMEQALENIAEEQVKNQDEEEAVKEEKLTRTLPPPPLNLYEEFPDPPDEPPGTGVNAKVFYVCHEPGDPWISLPDVTAKQIRVARQIKRSFTGNLDYEVFTYPHFSGTEKNYLRAQIARISAGTQISPLGFYTFEGEEMGEEEEEEAGEEQEETGPKTTFNENPRFEPIPIRDLTDISMSFWMHHVPYILPQGRTTWWNPSPPEEELGEEVGEEEETDEKPSGPEPEIGPGLLTPLSEDASLEAVPPWSVRSSSGAIREYALAVVRSNLWPGAYCLCNQGRIFHNVYFGYGHKFMATNFSPSPLTPVQQDYPIGPEVMEVVDPLGRDEEQWRIDHLPKPKPEVEGEEEIEEEEEEEEEDED